MAEDTKSEIDEMLDGMLPGTGDEPPAEPPAEPPPEEPPVEPPPAEPPVEEPPVEPPAEPPVEPPPEEPPAEPPVEEPPPPEEPPAEEPPVVPPPAAETAEERTSRIEEQNKLLLERIEVLSTPEHLRVKPPVEPPPGEPPAEPPPAVPPVVPLVVEPPPVEPPKPIDFLKGRPIEDFDTVEGLNALLNEVATQAKADTPDNTDAVVEKILRTIPTLVAGQIVQQNTMNEMVKDFYGVNKDLLGAKRTMGVFANEVHSEHPDWETKDVFNEAGTRTRKALGLRAQATTPTKRSPAFAKQRGARKGGGEEPTGVEKEIDELM